MLQYTPTADLTFRVEARYTSENKRIARDTDFWGLEPGLPPGGVYGDGSCADDPGCRSGALSDFAVVEALCAPGDPPNQTDTWPTSCHRYPSSHRKKECGYRQ